MRPVSPYHAPGFFAEALAQDRHRDIVGGRWDETGEVQMAVLQAHGLRPEHHLLDIGAGSLRLGCKAVPYLDPGHYWATDLSGALMRRGYEAEMASTPRLDPARLIEDGEFAFPGVPAHITHAIAFAVFTHLPLRFLESALPRLHARFPLLQKLFFTIFLAPPEVYDSALRQPDGVVTHPDRTPYHHREAEVLDLVRQAGFSPVHHGDRLPRGQRLITATR